MLFRSARWPDVAASLAAQFDNPRVEESAWKFERIITGTPCADRREWANLRVPALVLANRLDPVHPFEFGEEMARLIPGAEFRELTPKSARLVKRDYADRFKETTKTDQRTILSQERSLGSVIKLLSPSSREYSEDYNDWLRTIPQYIKEDRKSVV